jgi:hypothetical protein
MQLTLWDKYTSIPGDQLGSTGFHLRALTTTFLYVLSAAVLPCSSLFGTSTPPSLETSWGQRAYAAVYSPQLTCMLLSAAVLPCSSRCGTSTPPSPETSWSRCPHTNLYPTCVILMLLYAPVCRAAHSVGQVHLRPRRPAGADWRTLLYTQPMCFQCHHTTVYLNCGFQLLVPAAVLPCSSLCGTSTPPSLETKLGDQLGQRACMSVYSPLVYSPQPVHAVACCSNAVQLTLWDKYTSIPGDQLEQMPAH